ncbi:MAG: transcription termination factor Rho [Clostridiales bacterium]|jgi:transcription termination factor Rho|nr:transcription termination factor Rho [Clostridiales bacterium]
MSKEEILETLRWTESDLNLEKLAEKGIFELRLAARKAGIASPTTLSKGELVDAVLAILSGDAEPSERETRRGRPPRNPSIFIDRSNSVRNDMERSPKDFRGTQQYENMPQRTTVLREQGTTIDRLPEDFEIREGILDIHPEGYGFIRVKNCEYDEMDAYIHNSKIKKLGLRNGDVIKGQCRINTDGKPAMVIVDLINGVSPQGSYVKRPFFDELKPIFPDEKFTLECEDSKNDFAIRMIDLISPIGKGQRGLIVSPPKAGKTMLLKKIAKGISVNYPDVLLMVLLIDERPEEVTDIQRSIKGEVVYSTFDETPEHHIMAAEIVLNKAKRQIELGRDVVILLDSLTRLSRAYNNTVPPSGKTLSGGIDPTALQGPKKFFGAARNVENGGSLTIIATALIDTGSRMDDVIYEEFKGTGNMEIHLDRRLSERRIFPALDLNRSGTRREDLLLNQEEMDAMWGIRKFLSNGDPADTTEKLLGIMTRTKDNKEFVSQMNVLLQGMKKDDDKGQSGSFLNDGKNPSVLYLNDGKNQKNKV